MADNQQKDLFTQAELDTFSKWAAAQEAAGEKITFRAVKAYMKCGHIKAEALRKQYEDDKTRGAIEVAQVADLPENVLNALSEHINGKIKDVVEKLRSQVKEAEARAAETAEMLENAERTAENATQERDLARQDAAAFKAKLDVLEKEQQENRESIARLIAEVQAAKVEAARAQGALDALKIKQ